MKAITGYALIERASELCVQVYERCLADKVVDPSPRDFTRSLLLLNTARFEDTGHGFPIPLTTAAMWYLVPPAER